MDIQLLKRSYLFRDHTAISSFLLKNPSVAATLFEAYKYIGLVWGNEATVLLDLSNDSEGSDGNRLSAYIQTNEPVRQAMSSLDEFDEMWWLQNFEGDRW